ncbi:MAG: VWA domain-containing protein [Verrucomicrobiales bacterium]|nr:VWA domain-containing protein [Verrucomicrobiales bacterium]
MRRLAERLLEVDLSDQPAVTPRTLLVWGSSVLLHALLVLWLGRAVVFTGARLGGVRPLTLTNASFEAYEGSFGTEEQPDGSKLFHVSTRMATDAVPAGLQTLTVTAGAVTGARAGNVPERPRPPQPKPPPARVVGENSFFGLRVEGRVIVFVIDVSGSMYEKTGTVTRMSRVFQQVEQTVWSLSAEQKFNIVLFASKAVPFAPATVSASEEHKRRASAFLAGDVDCGGTTNMGEGLTLALTMRPDLIMLLTDGEADSKPESIKSQVELLRRKFCPTSRICAVGFYLEPESVSERLLRDLTTGAGGEYTRLRKEQ